MESIDFNCDLGEGQGNDRALMPYITSCNVCCGFHAGGPQLVRKTVELAIAFDVKVGAHPSYDDRANFGRISQRMSSNEIYDLVLYQVAALYTITATLGESLHHVKMHGALYNDTASDAFMCEAAFKAVADIDADLKIYGLPETAHQAVSEQIGLTFIPEAFADRAYNDDGTLVNRAEKESVYSNAIQVSEQVFSLASRGVVLTSSGKELEVPARTICFHGDNDGVLDYLIASYDRLVSHHIKISSVDEV